MRYALALSLSWSVLALACACVGAQEPPRATGTQGPSLSGRAAAAENRGDYTAAADLYLELVDADPMRAEWVVAAGRCLGRAGRFNDAIDLLSSKRAQFVGVLSVPAMLARTLLLKVETGEGVLHPELLHADAIALCEEILAIDPNHEQALLILAQARYGSGDREAAEDAAEDAARRLPDHAGAQVLIGRIAFDRFRLNKRLLETSPDGGIELTEEDRAQLVAAIDVDRRRAKTAFARAAALDGTRAYAHVALGEIAAWDHDTADVLRHWQAALVAEPDARIGHQWLIDNVSWEQRRDLFEQAAASYRQRPDAAPSSATVLDWHAARALYDGGQWLAARQRFEAAFDADPDTTNALYYAGVCAWRLGDEDAAEAHLASYARASATAFADVLRSLAPEWRGELSQLVRYLGDRAFRLDRKDNSRDLNHVIAALEDSADAWNNYAFLCRETERYADAFAGYEHALEKEPESPQLWNDAAVILQYHLPTTANKARAREMYGRALELADKVLLGSDATDLERKRAAEAKSDARQNLAALDG